MDKANLHQRIAELDEKMKFLSRSKSTSGHLEQPVKIKVLHLNAFFSKTTIPYYFPFVELWTFEAGEEFFKSR